MTKYSDESKKKIIKIMAKTNKLYTPETIRHKLGLSWNTADRYLKEMEKEKLVTHMEIAKIKIYHLTEEMQC